MRKIPSLMATQHPDNAGRPYWLPRAFLSTKDEVKESFLCFSDLGIDEYNWDWEGKFVDEAVVDRLLHKHLSYFKKHPLGKEKFLTFRIPNPRVEKQFRLARAFMVVVTSSQLAQSLSFADPPIFEAILPLTETPDELIEIQEAFRDLVNIDHRLLKMKDSVQHIELIPLFEQVAKMIDSANLLREYIRLHKKAFGKTPDYIRPYCARSDPALNSGLVPTILALKLALSSYLRLEEETGVKLYPMVGTGSLPFRGSVTPDTVNNALEEYAGVSTIILQSAFRYDYPLSKVKEAVSQLKKELPKRKATKINTVNTQKIRKVLPFFEQAYQKTIETLSPLINSVSMEVGKRRERMLHIGLFGYSRGMGKVTLPRAIPFTAALYSLGLPPEIIGTGRGIRKAKKQGLWETVSPYYLHLKDDLVRAGYFLNKENAEAIAKEKNIWYDIKEDITAIEEELGIELGPKIDEHSAHRQLAKEIYKRFTHRKKLSQLITYGGKLRRSLG